LEKREDRFGDVLSYKMSHPTATYDAEREDLDILLLRLATEDAKPYEAG
jgi:hypothetical protein